MNKALNPTDEILEGSIGYNGIGVILSIVRLSYSYYIWQLYKFGGNSTIQVEIRLFRAHYYPSSES